MGRQVDDETWIVSTVLVGRVNLVFGHQPNP
jgi:hypothetical protein